MVEVSEVSAIKSQVLSGGREEQRFPRAVNFPFSELYRELATRLPTTEISAECILLSATEATAETRELADPAYWVSSCAAGEVSDFWFFGRNGQGDSWLLDQAGQVYFYDHDQGELARKNFNGLGLTFEQWLQFADLSRQWEEMNEVKTQPSEADKANYRRCLAQLSARLLANFPFDL